MCALRAVGLAFADPRCVVENLAVEVRKRDDVIVDDADGPDARARQILQHRRAEAARADHERPGGLQLGLPGTADAAQHDLARVALDFLFR